MKSLKLLECLNFSGSSFFLVILGLSLAPPYSATWFYLTLYFLILETNDPRAMPPPTTDWLY